MYSLLRGTHESLNVTLEIRVAYQNSGSTLQLCNGEPSVVLSNMGNNMSKPLEV